MAEQAQPQPPRPTERFERVLAFASDAADGLGHGYVTCQHVLLSLCREEKGIAFATLQRCGVTSQAVTAWLEDSQAPHDRTPFTLLDLAEETRAALTRALESAARRAHRWVDTEHLLEALLAEHTSADDIFSELHVDLDDLRQQLETYRQSVPTHTTTDEATHAYRFTVETAWILSQANHAARSYGAAHIAALHVLLALTQVQSDARQVLRDKLNLTTDRLTPYLQAEGPPTPHQKRIPLGPAVQVILGYAIGEAWNRRHLAVKPIHIAMALAQSGRNPALDLLAELGISQARLHDALEDAMPPPVVR